MGAFRSTSHLKPVLIALLGAWLVPTAAGAQVAKGEQKVRAVVEAVEEAVLVARLQETLTKIPQRPGITFKKGDVLVEYDCRELKAQRQVAHAALNTKALDLQNKKALRKLKAIGRHDVLMAQSEVNKASAEAKVYGVQLNNCTIKAPFDGRVSEVFANTYEAPPRDGRLLAIVSAGKLELRVIVPSKWLAWLTAGSRFEFVSDDTGTRYPATVGSIGGKVDAVSQTITIVSDVENADGRLLPGMSGEAVFQAKGS